MENDELIEYESLIADVKDKIYQRQYETLKYVNSQTIKLYWEIGEEIYNQQKEKDWGKSVVEILARELQKEFPGAKGYSAQNLWRMRSFYLEYKENEKLSQLAREISWTNNCVIISKCKDEREREFYIQMVKRFGWSKNILTNFIEAKTYEKYLLNQTNFERTLPEENPSIGIIICKSKDKTYVEYALKQSTAPIGVATYKLSNHLPDDMKAMLPEPDVIVARLAAFKESMNF